MIKGSALKLPQPAACPLMGFDSLIWVEISFCVIRHSLFGEDAGAGFSNLTDSTQNKVFSKTKYGMNPIYFPIHSL
jgi:hypothetical protein